MRLEILMKKISFVILAACLLSVLAISGCRKSSPPKESVPAVSSPSTTEKVSKTDSFISKSLDEIISHRTSWNPILTDSYGKQMPDLKVTDISGKTINLADYHGRDVLVVFWATWCQPCLMEIPHLTALREIMPVDKLAILAISNEPVDTVKAMAESQNITYMVSSYQGDLPEPFKKVKAFPSAFYIRPNGTLKLATEGTMHLGEMKSILLAE